MQRAKQRYCRWQSGSGGNPRLNLATDRTEDQRTSNPGVLSLRPGRSGLSANCRCYQIPHPRGSVPGHVPLKESIMPKGSVPG